MRVEALPSVSLIFTVIICTKFDNSSFTCSRDEISVP